jgi:hypothetical protein
MNGESQQKSCPTTCHEGAWGESRYSSYSFTTLALDGGEWSAARPSRTLAAGKGCPVPTVREAGWDPEPVWTHRLEDKSFRLCQQLNLNHRVIQPVARHYTNWATRLIESQQLNVTITLSTHVVSRKSSLQSSLYSSKTCHLCPALLFPFIFSFT